MGRILLVDDENDFRESIAVALRQASHTVEEVPDGFEALKRITHQPFDVVISDLRMPGKSGFVFLEEAALRVPGVIRIVLTALGTIENELECKKAGIDCLLTKPVNIDHLIKKIDTLLGLKEIQTRGSRSSR